MVSLTARSLSATSPGDSGVGGRCLREVMATITAHLDHPSGRWTATEAGHLRWDRGGRSQSRQLESPAVRLLLLEGPQARPWRLVSGHADGSVTLWRLPAVQRIRVWPATGSPVTAVTLSDAPAGERLVLTAHEDGVVRALGGALPAHGVALWRDRGAIDHLRCEGDHVIVGSGFGTRRVHWTGERFRSGSATPVEA